MLTNINLQFLQQKISDIGSALFFSESSYFLKLPVSIITVLKMDDEGQILFYINKPSQCLDAFKREFPVHLDFFRKGKKHSLKVNGTATIIGEEQYQCNTNMENKSPGLILIKVKIITAEYVEWNQQKKDNVLLLLWTRLHNWFFAVDPLYKSYALFNE